MPSGPDEKSSLWRAGCFFVGLALALVLLELSTGAFALPATRVVLTCVVLGLLLSLPFGLAWLADALPPKKSDVAWPEGAVRHSGDGGVQQVLVQTHPPSPSSSFGKPPKVKEVGAVWYVGWVVCWRAPLHLGDFALSQLYQAIGAVTGRNRHRRREISGSAASDHYEDPKGPSHF